MCAENLIAHVTPETPSFSEDDVKRVHTRVVGQIVGVYLEQPCEHILAELGEITCNVREKLGKSLVAADDEITGTPTILGALLEDAGPSLIQARIGQTCLSYIVEDRLSLWWGSLGYSTEPTADPCLKNSIESPHGDSAALHGQVMSEQIGAQIPTDGWAKAAPEKPGTSRQSGMSHSPRQPKRRGQPRCEGWPSVPGRDGVVCRTAEYEED
jgi:hypothetical protein